MYRAIVLLELDDGRGWVKLVRKIQDVSYAGSAKRVDRLRVVADDRHRLTDLAHDLRLDGICILIFVDEHVIKPPSHLFAISLHEIKPIEQQVIVIEHVTTLLRFDVALEELLQLVGPVGVCRERALQRLLDRLARVYGVRVDREAGVFLGEARGKLGESQIVTDDVEEIGGVGTIEDGKVRIQAHRGRVKS